MMKFLTLEDGQLGVLLDDAVVDVGAAAAALSAVSPATTLQALIDAGDEAVTRVHELALQARAAGAACRAYAETRPRALV